MFSFKYVTSSNRIVDEYEKELLEKCVITARRRDVYYTVDHEDIVLDAMREVRSVYRFAMWATVIIAAIIIAFFIFIVYYHQKTY